jgi:hypothetical protein
VRPEVREAIMELVRSREEYGHVSIPDNLSRKVFRDDDSDKEGCGGD